MDELTFDYLLTLTPVEAITTLNERQVTPSQDWYEVLDDAHQRAFVVAQMANKDMLNDVKLALSEALTNGLTIDQFQELLTPLLQRKGWWGKDASGVQLGSPYRLNTIYQTNMQTSYMAGRLSEMQAAVDTHPYWRYVAILDNRTRPTHRVLNGKVMPADDPAWRAIVPPNGFGCRCTISPMLAKTVERRGYTVESSEGYLSTETVKVGRNGETTQITVLQLPSMDTPFKVDAGFNSSPIDVMSGRQ